MATEASPTTLGERFAAAIAAIDAANAADPNEVTIGDVTGPKELVHGRMMSAWIAQLTPGAGEALQLAARGHHIRRWERPRSNYESGRAGYLRWRTELHDFHAAAMADILRVAGYDDAAIARVSDILHKRGLGRDAEVQSFEDALALVFIETQMHDLAARLDEATMVRALARTWRKMSDHGRDAARSIPIAPEDRALLERAIASATNEG